MLLLASCRVGEKITPPTDACVKCGSTYVFPDANLADAVRKATNTPKSCPICAENLPYVTSLDITANVNDFTGMDAMPNLVSISLSNCTLSDVNFLLSNTKLKTITINNSVIGSISGLDPLTQLNSFAISSCTVATTPDFSGAPALKAVTFTDSSQTLMTWATPLTSIQYVDISGNTINDLSPLLGKNSLTTLKAAHNIIADLSFIEQLMSLNNIDLSYNNVSDILPLVNSATSYGLKNGGTVDLTADPLNSTSQTTYMSYMRQHGVTVIYP